MAVVETNRVGPHPGLVGVEEGFLKEVMYEECFEG